MRACDALLADFVSAGYKDQSSARLRLHANFELSSVSFSLIRVEELSREVVRTLNMRL